MTSYTNKEKPDKETRKAIANARKLIENAAKADGNEAETRLRVLHIFGTVLGYDPFTHVSQEYAIHGSGDTVHCDFAIQLDHDESSQPDMLVELKRVNINLAPKHLKQAASYAYEHGCDWILLTNGREWKLYHVLFGKPPQTKLIQSWNLLSDDLSVLAKKFDIIAYKNVKKGSLAKLWEKSNVLTTQNILKAILSEESIRLVQRKLKAVTNVLVSPEDIVSSVRHLLHEAAYGEMEKIRISLPEKKQSAKGRQARKKTAAKKDEECLEREIPSSEEAVTAPTVSPEDDTIESIAKHVKGYG